MRAVIGIIGGSGFYALDKDARADKLDVITPFSETPVSVYSQTVAGTPVLFLPRHGREHGIPPHKVNYRANIWALKEQGVACILAANVVGGITRTMAPGTLVIPDQLIDYTWGRAHTCFDALETPENHIDFTNPYVAELRAALLAGAAEQGLACHDGAVYACTQGPRLETAAEIQKLARDGCDIVGMTGMPEAALARELGLPYASIALVVNWAAGITTDVIAFGEIAATMETGIADVRKVLKAAIPGLADSFE